MRFLISGNAPAQYPVETLFGILRCADGKALEIPYRYPLYGEWGAPVSNVYDSVEDMAVPNRINVVYLSVVERKFYSLDCEISKETQNRLQETLEAESEGDKHLVIGMAPYGKVCMWVSASAKRYFICCFDADETTVPMKCFRSSRPDATIEEICDEYISSLPIVKNNLRRYGLPMHDLYHKIMLQYRYRYVISFMNWNEDNECWEEYEDDSPSLSYIEDYLTDGSFDKLHDEGLQKYHFGGKPQKIALKWKIDKAEYYAHFWFDDRRLAEIIGRFYGAHRDTNTDFIIYIDVKKHKYELALFRYGIKEPIVIPETVYQMIVFKNMFECCRSENYDQPRGAWVW